MNKIQEEMKEDELWDWFSDKYGSECYEQAEKEIKEKYKDMPWYKKMLYNNDHFQETLKRTSKILNSKFRDANVGTDVGGSE